MSDTLKHKFRSLKADCRDRTVVRPSDWNEEHVFGGGAPGDSLVYDPTTSDHCAWSPRGGGVAVPLSAPANLHLVAGGDGALLAGTYHVAVVAADYSWHFSPAALADIVLGDSENQIDIAWDSGANLSYVVFVAKDDGPMLTAGYPDIDATSSSIGTLEGLGEDEIYPPDELAMEVDISAVQSLLTALVLTGRLDVFGPVAFSGALQVSGKAIIAEGELAKAKLAGIPFSSSSGDPITDSIPATTDALHLSTSNGESLWQCMFVGPEEIYAWHWYPLGSVPNRRYIKTGVVAADGMLIRKFGPSVIVCDATNGSGATCVVASSCKHCVFTVKKSDASANPVRITAAQGDTIDGAASVALTAQYEAITIISDGNHNWNVLSHYVP